MICSGIRSGYTRLEVLNAAIISSSAPAYEEQMMADWTRRTFVELVPAVRVPVHFSIAQHEKVWQRDSSALDEIAVLFSGAPRFILHEQPEAGHNISLGHTAGDYHTTVLSFVQQCLAERLANAQQDVDLAAE